MSPGPIYVAGPDSPHRVPFDGSFEVRGAPTHPSADAPTKKELRRALRSLVQDLSEYQRVLYAHNRISLLCVFQALDAAGKDSTIRAVTSGINPAGFQVFSFKAPSAEELDHDFLWRTARRVPERGRIGVFNRSYYEEVLVVRVHPAFLERQGLEASDALWEERFESIRTHERHLAHNGTVVLKFWLNISREEQRQRFLDRIETPSKNWKFRQGDVTERSHWDDYMHAYEAMLRATSRPWAPWYSVPADSKPYMRVQVATILRDTLAGLGLSYPALTPEARAELDASRLLLESDTETPTSSEA